MTPLVPIIMGSASDLEHAKKIAEGAAMMTRTSLSVDIKSAVWPTRCNRVLAELLDRNIRETGMPTWTSDEVSFPDQEYSIWEYDERTEQLYLHRFYKTQPDLNITNPVVRDEIVKAMVFFLELGVSGFRVDAVPFML